MPEDMADVQCNLKRQGYAQGSCAIISDEGLQTACQATLKYENGTVHRLITSIHLSRPENYLSIYQSGCNFSCKKCHSWYFTKMTEGEWETPETILEKAVAYEKIVTLEEPREKATAWHAHDTCNCCGSCVEGAPRPESCPGVLKPEAVIPSPQGYGPARNIVAFTGGDIACNPEFYGRCAQLIKENTRLHLLLETNGYGLTPSNLDYLKDSGIDAYWLDIKAYDRKVHKWLTGCSNDNILKLPEEIIKRGFVLEVLSLYIPNLVMEDELEKIAKIIARVDPDICFTILAFFPEFQMNEYKTPTVQDMAAAYSRVKKAGLKNIRLGNLGVFLKTEKDVDFLFDHVDPDAY